MDLYLRFQVYSNFHIISKIQSFGKVLHLLAVPIFPSYSLSISSKGCDVDISIGHSDIVVSCLYNLTTMGFSVMLCSLLCKETSLITISVGMRVSIQNAVRNCTVLEKWQDMFFFELCDLLGTCG